MTNVSTAQGSPQKIFVDETAEQTKLIASA